MGMKYMIYAFNYTHMEYDASKQTRFLIVSVFWFILFSIKYDGVDIQKRS